MGKLSQPDNPGERDAAAATPSRDREHTPESALRRADELRQELTNAASEKDGLLVEALEELRTTLEELQVAEEELRQQNEELLTTRSDLEAEKGRYKDMFEFAPDAYLTTDREGKITEANQAALRLLGVERKFIVGKSLITFVGEKRVLDLRNLISTISKSIFADPSVFEIRLRSRVTKHDFDAELHVARTADRQNQIVLRWLVRDITKRKEAETQIRDLNVALEEKVRARTAELEQVSAFRDELLTRERKARAEAEAANRGKDEFFAIVSHELRTPLNTILGWAQMLRSDSSTTEHIERAAEVIERNAKAQARIINDILDVSRAVTGNLRLDLTTLDLAALVESIVEDARPAIEEKQITLTVNIDPAVGSLLGDDSRLRQVVENLLTNSIKFTASGQRIDVSVYREGSHACIQVTDSGVGIAPDFLPHVFDRFRQAHTPYTKRQSGLGLGLSIARLLIEMHGGSISASSDGEGKGATFTIKLPVISAARTIDAAADDQEKESLHRDLLEGVWILVVDDDLDAREMMRVVLEGAGARVTTCESCAEAIGLFFGKSTAALTPRLPDIMIADIAMPEEDGFDLIRRLRSLEPVRGGTIPAIALTADSSDEVRENAIAAGYQLHLSKPMHLEKLVEAISALATNKHQGQAT